VTSDADGADIRSEVSDARVKRFARGIRVDAVAGVTSFRPWEGRDPGPVAEEHARTRFDLEDGYGPAIGDEFLAR
jgi:hypothetical protein